MKGSSLYGKVNLNRGGQANRPDGRAKSSAFQDIKKAGAPKKKDYAHKDYDTGTSKIIAAAKGGASKEEIRAMVQAHNQSTIGKKYKKGSMSNSQINVKNMWSYMPKETVTEEKPVETKSEVGSGLGTPKTQPDVTSELAEGLDQGPLTKKSPMEAKKVTNEDGSTTRTSKNIITGRTKTVTRNAEGKKTSVSKRSKTDKEGNVKYKQKDIRRGSGGKKIVHTSKGKYSEKTGAQVGTSKEKVKRNYGPKKGTTKYTEEA